MRRRAVRVIATIWNALLYPAIVVGILYLAHVI